VRWWWRHKCKNNEGIKDAEAALEREKQAGKAAAAKAPGVNQLANDLARHKQENNFSRLFEQSMHPQQGRRSL